MIILAFCALVLLIIIAIWKYVRWEHGILEEMGVPIIKSHPILGSIRDVYEKPGGLEDIKWRKQYGPIFGIYEGRQAQLFVCDPELVRLMCVKDADYFHSKRSIEFGDPVMNEMPDFQPLEKWRILRALGTPAFTSAKVKMMNLPMREATEDFINTLKQKIRSSKTKSLENYPIDTSLHTMLTDLISRCVFSIKINSNEGNNEFAKIVQDIVTPATEGHNLQLVLWSHVFPILKKALPSVFNTNPIKRFVQLFKEMMEHRKQSGATFNDVVDMYLEWHEKLDSPEFKEAKITDLSLLCQALVFFFAAQDQISTLVSVVIYQMAIDTELNRKIYNEVDSMFKKYNGKIHHEQLPEFTIVNACLNEALRLYPFFHRAERVCTKDWYNEKYGLAVKKGMVVQFPIWAINRDPETNENPDNFDHERFMPENKHKLNPYSSTSFGHGPRNCTGKRFAMEAMPLVLVYMLRDFKFVARENTKLEFTPGGPFFQPHEPIFVDVLERDK